VVLLFVQNVFVEKQVYLLHHRRACTCLLDALLRAFEGVIERDVNEKVGMMHCKVKARDKEVPN
jgi:hypothetical protein